MWKLIDTNLKVNEHGFQARLITEMLPVITGKNFEGKKKKERKINWGNVSKSQKGYRGKYQNLKRDIGGNIKISKGI